jgi:hypothetical protein
MSREKPEQTLAEALDLCRTCLTEDYGDDPRAVFLAKLLDLIADQVEDVEHAAASRAGKRSRR